MEHKHTPGPWEVRFDHPDVPERIAFIRPASHPDEYSSEEISSVYGCGPDVPGNETEKANARLIAAAPDLLAELQHAHQIIRNALNIMTLKQKSEWGRMNERDNCDGEGVTRANERLVAIAKATGEAA